MTAGTDLLPLPEGYAAWYYIGSTHVYSAGEMESYARANVAHAIAPLQAEIEALRAEVATWEGLHASEVQVRQRWQARAERLAEALRDAADDIDAGVPPEDAAAHLRARADLLRDQEEGK